MDFITKILPGNQVYRAELLVILGVVFLLLYVLYSLKLIGPKG